MEKPLMLAIAFAATLLGGMAIGFMAGIAKGMSLGATFRTGRPVSPVPWMLCFIGAGVFLLTAIGTSVYSVYFLSNSIQTTAVVTAVVERKDSEGHVSRALVYGYRNASGQEFTDRSSTSDGREFVVGDVMPIRYIEDAPHESRIDYFSHHWMLPLFMLIFSLMLGGLGFALRWWRGKEQLWAGRKLVAKSGNAPG